MCKAVKVPFSPLPFFFQKSSSSSVLSALRNQLLKEVSSLVPSGVRQQLTEKKLQMSSEMKPHSTDRHHVSESHADKETLEILQGMYLK